MIHETLVMMQDRVWQPAGFASSEIAPELESADYCAHTLLLNGRRILFRAAKTTPTKVGQFVTLWKRSQEGPIRPVDMDDGVSTFVIHAALGAGLGQFVFPVQALARHGVVSVDGRGGKRAMRVYPPNVVSTNTQARRTQAWQCEYFLPIDAHVAQIRAMYSA